MQTLADPEKGVSTTTFLPQTLKPMGYQPRAGDVMRQYNPPRDRDAILPPPSGYIRRSLTVGTAVNRDMTRVCGVTSTIDSPSAN